MANESLQSAKSAKNDEFYTRFDDIQRELNYYKDQFKGKIVYCNCDDPAESAFSDYFKLNFNYLGLKKLICTRYAKSDLFQLLDPVKKFGYKLEITGPTNLQKIELKGDGDFRSKECLELLKEADIVCTNPPFSLFREYIAQLMSQGKKFLVVGPINAITYEEIFPFIKGNKMWSGYTNPKQFTNPMGEIEKLGNVQWWTNLDVAKRHIEIVLYENYSLKKYPKYDNYDAINVDKTVEIPKDYFGVMGVPISFLDKYNPEQFIILGITDRQNTSGLRTKIYTVHDSPKYNDLNRRSVIKIDSNYKTVYARLLIKRKVKNGHNT